MGGKSEQANAPRLQNSTGNTQDVETHKSHAWGFLQKHPATREPGQWSQGRGLAGAGDFACENEETEHLDNGERVQDEDVRHGRIRRADRRGGQGRRGEGRLGDHGLKV